MNSTVIRHDLLEYACNCYENLVRAYKSDSNGFHLNADVNKPLLFPSSYSRQHSELEKALKDLSALFIKAFSQPEQLALKPLLSKRLKKMKKQKESAAKKIDDAAEKQAAMERIKGIAMEIDRDVAAALRKVNLNEMLECGEKLKACVPATRTTGAIPEHVQTTLTTTICDTHYLCKKSGITVFVDRYEVQLRESITIECLPQFDSLLVGADELAKSVENLSRRKRPIKFGELPLHDSSKAVASKRDWFKLAKGGLLITGNVVEGALHLLTDAPKMDYPTTWRLLLSVLTGASDIKDGLAPKN